MWFNVCLNKQKCNIGRKHMKIVQFVFFLNSITFLDLEISIFLYAKHTIYSRFIYHQQHTFPPHLQTTTTTPVTKERLDSCSHTKQLLTYSKQSNGSGFRQTERSVCHKINQESQPNLIDINRHIALEVKNTSLTNG